jgi:hypothetical protein
MRVAYYYSSLLLVLMFLCRSTSIFAHTLDFGIARFLWVKYFDRVGFGFRPSRYVSTESPRVSTECINYLWRFDRVY